MKNKFEFPEISIYSFPSDVILTSGYESGDNEWDVEDV